MSEDLHERVSAVETEIENLKENHRSLEENLTDLRSTLDDTRSDLRKGMESLSDQLQNVVTNALDSMPKWAARQFGNNHKLIGILISLLGIAVTAILWMTFRGHP